MDFITFLNHRSPEIVLEAAGDGYLDPIHVDNDPLKVKKISSSEKKNAREFLENLSYEKRSSISYYTGGGYHFQNQSLRGGKETTNVNDIIKKYKCSEDMWVFRGWGGKLDVQKLKKGDRYSLKGITSTTQDLQIAGNFASGKSIVYGSVEHEFINKIFIPKGSPALDVSSVSQFKEEKEIVLPHNSIIEVIDHEVYVTGKKHQYHIVNFKLVS